MSNLPCISKSSPGARQSPLHPLCAPGPWAWFVGYATEVAPRSPGEQCEVRAFLSGTDKFSSGFVSLVFERAELKEVQLLVSLPCSDFRNPVELRLPCQSWDSVQLLGFTSTIPAWVFLHFLHRCRVMSDGFMYIKGSEVMYQCLSILTFG